MSTIIRQAVEADYEALCALLAEIDALHAAALPGRFREADGPARSREFIEAAIDAEDEALLVAASGDRLVGVAHVVTREARDVAILVPMRYASIDTLAVDSASRREGIGRASPGPANCTTAATTPAVRIAVAPRSALRGRASPRALRSK